MSRKSFTGKYAVRKAAPPRKLGAPTEKQINALRNKMGNAISLDLTSGIKALRASVNTRALLEAVHTGKYKGLERYVRGKSLTELFSDVAETLMGASGQAAEITIKRGLPKGIGDKLKFDTRNPNIREYAQTRVGALIQNVDDDTQAWVGKLISQNMDQVRDIPRLAEDIKDKLRGGIGLNDQQQGAYDRFEGTDEQRAALGEKLLGQRAETIARTESSYALNQGVLDVWQTSKDQGLIAEDSRKVWHAIGHDPCIICDPMDGVEVGLDEEFSLVTGETIQSPPAHPRCYCVMSISNTTGDEENPKDSYDDLLDDQGDEANGT